MWKLTYDAPKGLRTNRGFWAITTDTLYLSFFEKSKVWDFPCNHSMVECHSTHDHGPKTTKAFKRYLNKHPELKDHKVIFVHTQYYPDIKGERVNLHITAEWVES